MTKVWLVFVACLVCGPALSQTSIYDRCISAIEAGDSTTVTALATTIQRFNSIPTNDLDSATECVSQAVSEPMKFDTASGRFVPAVTYSEVLQ